jgi:hypothetical protein
MNSSEIARHSRQLLERGFTVLEGVSPDEVQDARTCVVENAHLLRNTRPNPSSGHLAGFHRYPDVEPLHALVSSNPLVLEIFEQATGCSLVRSIGLSDITVNRSQQWHVDLLRGKYRHHLTPEACWGDDGGGVYKVLLYLQSGATLRVLPGTHKKAVPLDDDSKSEPLNPADIEAVEVAAGGIVLMDIRLRHRGSTEAELSNGEFVRNPKILVSTVLGGDRKPLTEAMERGNLERLLDWDRQHMHSGQPRLDSPEEPVELAAQ